MSVFLGIVGEVIGQMNDMEEYDPEIFERLKAAYQMLSREEKEKNIRIVDEKLRGDRQYYFAIMSNLLCNLKDEYVLQCIRDMLVSKACPLWERYSYMLQLKDTMFRISMPQIDEYTKYRVRRDIYENILQDISKELGEGYSRIQYQDRRKTVVMVVGQLLNVKHAPTRKLFNICKYLWALGYEVTTFVCFHPGKRNGDNILWFPAFFRRNFCEQTTAFDYTIGESTIGGVNLALQPESFLDGLRDFTRMIWEQKPEYVFELGDETMLAGLCSQFTTVVTMGCTKSAPVTTAPIVARYFDYSEEENRSFHACLTENQIVIDVKHAEEDLEKNAAETKELHGKQDFGIQENAFVIVIAGNRLDMEVTAEILEVCYDILEKDERFMILIIGECGGLKQTVAESRYMKRIVFTGNRGDFRETIAVGDLFLNPPRQGGGTGAFLAGELGIPVVTLDHCDVESIAGKDFVCSSVEEMPSLVYRYFTDYEFYKKQSERIMKNIGRQKEIDSVGNFGKLCELVKLIEEEKESRANEC